MLELVVLFLVMLSWGLLMESEAKHLGFEYKKEILHCAMLSLRDALRCVQNDIVSLSQTL